MKPFHIDRFTHVELYLYWPWCESIRPVVLHGESVTASKVVQVVSFSAHCRNNITVCTGGGQGGGVVMVVMVHNHSGRAKRVCKISAIRCFVYYGRNWGWIQLRTEKGKAHVPLYQNTLPRSCGPRGKMQIRFISLSDLTYKSDGPTILAFNSADEKRKK